MFHKPCSMPKNFLMPIARLPSTKTVKLYQKKIYLRVKEYLTPENIVSAVSITYTADKELLDSNRYFAMLMKKLC